MDEDDLEYSLSDRLKLDHGSSSTTDSPTHSVPFFTSRDELGEYQSRCWQQGKPTLYIQQIKLRKWCFVAIQMPWVDDDEGNSDYLCLTDEAISKINNRVSKYQDRVRESGYGMMGPLTASKADFQMFSQMKPNVARKLADEIHPIVMDPSNVELKKNNVNISLDPSEWPSEWTDLL